MDEFGGDLGYLLWLNAHEETNFQLSTPCYSGRDAAPSGKAVARHTSATRLTSVASHSLRANKSALSSFSRLQDPSHTGPPDARVSGPVIRSEYDGVAHEYYCYRGIWFERAFD